MYAKKVEYLKGLMAGLPLDPNTNEYKLFTAVIDALESMSEALSDAEEDITDLEDSVDEIDDELDNLSDFIETLQGMANEDDTEYAGLDDDEDEDDENGDYEVTCPGCEHVFTVDEETIFLGKVTCPGCKEKLSFEVDGCGCGHCHEEGRCSHDEDDK